MPAATPIQSVKVDTTRGHISLVVDDAAAGAFVDLGSELHWWSHTSLHMSPEQAHEVGSALVAWAARRQGRATS